MRLPITDPITAIAIYTLLLNLSDQPPAPTDFLPEITHHAHDGVDHLTFWISGAPAQPANSLIRAYHHEVPAKNLQITQPAAPFLAARYAVETTARLSDWQAARTGTPALLRTHGPLLRTGTSAALEYDLLRHAWRDGSLVPLHRIACPAFAAALITCGFPVYPQLCPPGPDSPLPTFVFPAASLTFPDLTLPLLLLQIGLPLQIDPLPGYALGEHPFDYAHAAATNASLIPQWIHAARQRPKIFLRGTGSSGVFASQSLLEASHPDPKFRDRVLDFIP